MYRKIIAGCRLDELLFPFAHFFTFPAYDGIFINRQAFVGDNQIFVNTHYFAKSFAYRTSTDRAIEAKHQIAGFFKLNSISFEMFRKIEHLNFITRIKADDTVTFTFVKSCFYGFRKTTDIGRIFVTGKTVDQEKQIIRV